MIKRTGKFLSILLTAAMVFTMLPVSAFAEGAKDVVVTTPGGIATLTGGFNYTATTAPSAVQNLSAAAYDGRVVLAWDAPSSDGGSPITDYYIGWGIGDIQFGPVSVSGSVFTYSVTGLTNGSKYLFRVLAFNGSQGTKTDIYATPQASTSSGIATIVAGSLASRSLSGNFTGGAAITNSSTLTVTIPDTSKTNATLRLTKGDTAATVKYVKGTQPANDGGYTETYSGNNQIAVEDGDTIWLMVTAENSTTKLYYKITVTVQVTLAYTVTAVPTTTTPTAGGNNSVVFTVKDSTGATDANFNGAKNVTIKGASAAPNGSYGSFNGVTLTSASQTVSVQFSGGTATANLILNKAAAQNITFGVAGVATTLASAGTITPKFAAASKAKIVTQPAGAVSSKALATQPIIHIVDQYENLVTNSTLTITATVTAGGSTVTAGNTANAVGGTATFVGLTLTTASTGVVLTFTPAGLTAAAAPALTVSPIPLLSGDVNGNGSVGMDDLVALARHIAEVNIITDTSLLKNADVNSDGNVNIADLIRLSRWLSGNDKTPLGQP